VRTQNDKANSMEDLENLKKEYESNKSDYLKWIFLRFGAILSIIIAIYSGTRNIEKKNFKGQLDSVNYLAWITHSVPESNDIFIQYLYLKPAKDEIKQREPGAITGEISSDTSRLANYYRILLKDSLMEEKLKLKDNLTNDSILKLEEDQLELKDTLRQWIAAAESEQEKIVRNIERASDKEFIINFSFVGGSIDLRYGIFFIPLLFILSEVYFFLLRIKFSILTATIKRNFSDEQLFTLNFIRQPSLFLSKLLRFFELLMLALFLKTIIIFSGSVDFLYTVAYISGVALLIYYAALVANLYAIEMNPNESMLMDRKENLIQTFRWAEKLMRKVIFKVSKVFSVATGSILIIITLFTTVTFNGCNDTVKGYEFFKTYTPLHFDPTWWLFGGKKPTIQNDSLGSITGTHAYLLSIVIGIVCILLLLYNLTRPKNDQKMVKWYFWLLLISGSCFLIFVFLFSVIGSIVISIIPFFDLSLVVCWILFVKDSACVMKKEEWLLAKIKMIALTFPLIITNLLYFSFFSVSTFGQPVLYAGLLFLMIGLYKYANGTARSAPNDNE
jgi:hypothetical protein